MTDDPTLTGLIARRFLDPDLAGLLGLLRERRLGLIAAGSPGSGARAVADALDDLAVAGASANAGVPWRPAIHIDAAESLEEVLVALAGAPHGLAPDEVRSLGVVVIARSVDDLGPRLQTAHYLRPVERDAGGHLQRRPPALLAARDTVTDRLEHFWWAVTGELAERTGLGLAEFEKGQRQRSALLRELVGQGLLGREQLLSALAPHRPS